MPQPKPITYNEYPSRASMLGQSVGQAFVQSLFDKFNEAEERKREEAERIKKLREHLGMAYAPYTTPDITEKYLTGEISGEDWKPLAQVQAEYGPKKETSSLAEKEASQKRLIAFRKGLERGPKMMQLQDRWFKLFESSATKDIMGRSLPIKQWPVDLQKSKLSLESEMKKIDPNWMTYTPPPIEEPEEEITGLAGMPFVGSEYQLIKIKKYLKGKGYAEDVILSTIDFLKNNPEEREKSYRDLLR
jgi:hypothetical protein